jgi:hypothetical protein
MATRALVHNGCTTGVEAYALGVPCLAYRPRIDERIDDAFYRLPNAVSTQCFTLENVVDTLRGVLSGSTGTEDDPAHKAMFDHCVAGLEGASASERIVDVLDSVDPETPVAGAGRRFEQRVLRFGLNVVRRYRAYLPGEQNSPAFQRHRYPGAGLDELRARVARWQAVLGDSDPLDVQQLEEHVFRIASRGGTGVAR